MQQPQNWNRQRVLEPLLSLVPESDAAPREVVRRDLEGNAIAGEHTDAKPSHLARDSGVDIVSVVHLHTEGRVGENFSDGTFELDCFFLGHTPPLVCRILVILLRLK
jgi:hypothetical protein